MDIGLILICVFIDRDEVSWRPIKNKKNRLFTVPYFSVKPSRKSAFRYGPPSWFRWPDSSPHMKPRWRPVAKSAGCRRSYIKIRDFQSTRKRTTPIFSQQDQTSRWELIDLLCGRKEDFFLRGQRGKSRAGKMGQEQYETTPTLFPTQNCQYGIVTST